MKVFLTLFFLPALIFLTVTSGCAQKRDLSPPPVKINPKNGALILVEPQSKDKFSIRMVARYGNRALECSNIDYLHSLGGHVKFPNGDVEIKQVGGGWLVYNDFYEQRPICPWKLMGVVIYIRSNSGREAVSGLFDVPLISGAKKDVVCEFLWNENNTCLLLATHADRPGVRVSISVN